jgi:putative transposase
LRQIYIESYYWNGYSRFMQLIEDTIDHPQRTTIEKRLEIIKFFDEHGARITRQAFKKSRATIYLWKQKLKASGGKLSSLAPKNKSPLHRRKRIPHPFIESFIIKYRTNHPGADKTTITPVLTTACQQANVKPVSESTVGRIIHDLKDRGRLPRWNRITINGNSGNLLVRERKCAQKKARRKGYTPRQPGDLVQMDTVAIFAAGVKRYIFTGLDISTRFAFAHTYKSNSSANGRDFLEKFIEVAPFNVRSIQTDNGSEFAKHFADYCHSKRLTHFYNYPKHPQSNGHLERFNRTVQEQFVEWHIEKIDETELFNRPLMDYLIWYNTERPHRGIGKVAPLRYYLDNFVSPPEKSNILWTLTRYCNMFAVGVSLN